MRGAFASLLAVGVVVPVNAANASSTTGWQVVRHGGLAAPSSLGDVEATGPKDVWVVGSQRNGASSVLLHWDGAHWAKRPSPPGGASDIEVVSPREVWALTDGSTDTPLYRYDGKRWQATSNTGRPASLSVEQLTVASGQVWEPYVATVGHFDGSRWRESEPLTDENGTIDRVEARTANDVWAFGRDDLTKDGATFATRWDGKAWKRVAIPDLGGRVHDVVANAADDVWAVAEDDDADYAAVVAHWDGMSWRKVAAPGFAASFGTSLAVASNGDVWLTGSTDDDATVSARYRAGKWSRAAFPLPKGAGDVNIWGLTAVPGTSTVWAVGETFDTNDPDECPSCRDVTYRHG